MRGKLPLARTPLLLPILDYSSSSNMLRGAIANMARKADPERTDSAAQALLDSMDTDLETLTREELIAEVVRLRNSIRAHRDSSGHDLCWHHPQLWGLLPEPIPKNIAVPDWPQFLRGCVKYREALDRELPDAPRTDAEFGDTCGRPK
jgi:hypothetical protein